MGAESLYSLAELVLRELALFAAVGFLVGGLDDLLLDLAWMLRRLRGWYDPAPAAAPLLCSFGPPAERGRLAVFVPAWEEAGVIGPMLAHTARAFAGQDYRLFAGCYPNDPLTAAEIRAVARDAAAVTPVVCPRPGPTTKADCLNALWRALEEEERESGRRFKAVVLHDAEDVVDPDEIALFDRLVEDHALVQIPVIPLVDPRSRWIAGHYCDEFAEAHAKNLVVRNALGAGVPSAGVGCAIDRDMLGDIAAQRGGAPFDAESLTEDYELGLRIAERGGRSAFVRMRREDGPGLIAVRAHFPARLAAAVRQKSRWITGIALAGWDRLGWSGGVAETWMRLRDRRAILAALVLAAAYAALLLWAGFAAVAWWLGAPGPQASPALLALLRLNLALLVWRLAMRAAFTARCYGWREGARAVPRALVSNVVSMIAARRALARYLAAPRQAVWEKTGHVFPGPMRTP